MALNIMLWLGTLLMAVPRGARAHQSGHSKALDFPACLSECIEGSGCDATNIKCMCRASQGGFLPDVVSCIYSDCSRAISVDTLLRPLELACNVLGQPIPDSAISSAEAAQSSIDNPRQSTTIVVTETTTAAASPSSRSSHTATSKPTTAVTEPMSLPTSEKSDSQPATSISLKSTSGAGLASTASSELSLPTTEAGLSSGAASQTSLDSATTTTTAYSGDPTDSSPFAQPINSGNRSSRGSSLLGAVMGLGAAIAFGC